MITYRKLQKALAELTDDQLDMTVTVSAGCDEHGHAEFFGGDAFTLAMNPDVEAAATDMFDDTQPIILFHE